MSSIYGGEVFAMARQQFDTVADHLGIPFDRRERIFLPKRALTVACPIHRDDGTVQVFHGYRVQHHLSLGPTKGGTRFAPGVDIGEVGALAIWMSWKCALAGLPYGGGKGGVAVDPMSLSPREFEALSRRYMQELIPFISPQTDVLAPDMGTNEQVMAWFLDTYSVHQGHTVTEIVTGKPVECGGTLGRREATGRGVVYLAIRALEDAKIEPSGTTAIIQGFGNVGSVAATEFAKRGVKVVGVSDHTAAFYDPKGLDVAALVEFAARNRVLSGFNADECDPSELLTKPCDILLPAARERVIDGANAQQLRCRILAEAANGPTTPEADQVLAERGRDITILPDILCNAGGVIVSYFEWVQGLQRYFWTEAEVNQKLYAVMEQSYAQVKERAHRDNLSYRNAALSIGIDRVYQARATRGLFP
jgi:glutamate dehydrogenase (NAD(P)+)